MRRWLKILYFALCFHSNDIMLKAVKLETALNGKPEFRMSSAVCFFYLMTTLDIIFGGTYV